MKTNFKFSVWMLVGLAALLTLLAGCQKVTASQEPASPAGLANPASVYCQALGFNEETRTGDGGDYGVCIFEDGSECDSWDFLAGRCGSEHSYCTAQGGTLKTNDTNIATCVFTDGSSCDEYAYSTGDCQP